MVCAVGGLEALYVLPGFVEGGVGTASRCCCLCLSVGLGILFFLLLFSSCFDLVLHLFLLSLISKEKVRIKRQSIHGLDGSVSSARTRDGAQGNFKKKSRAITIRREMVGHSTTYWMGSTCSDSVLLGNFGDDEIARDHPP